MKKTIVLLLALAPLALFAQKKDIQKTSFEVNGVCGMCKARIEKTAFSIKGVKTASWDIPSHQFTLLFDANKVSLESVHEAIAKAGHDTPLATAPDEVYENLPSAVSMTARKKKNKKKRPTGSLFYLMIKPLYRAQRLRFLRQLLSLVSR